jgi:hypothetical protein
MCMSGPATASKVLRLECSGRVEFWGKTASGFDLTGSGHDLPERIVHVDFSEKTVSTLWQAWPTSHVTYVSEDTIAFVSPDGRGSINRVTGEAFYRWQAPDHGGHFKVKCRPVRPMF